MLTNGPEPVRSQSDNDDIRITQEYETEDGFLFWPGDTFLALMGDREHWETHGTEVKTAGEYVWIPASCFEVI